MQFRCRALLAFVIWSISAVAAQAADLCHGAPSNVRLLIDVPNVRSNHGWLVANIYGPDKKRFLADDGWLYVWRDPARPGLETMCIYLPSPGPYEIVMFHDANGNGDLDQGAFGIPTEGYGFSNNVAPFLMPPSLKSTTIHAGVGDTRLQIRLRYP